jgi:hypothetical protein
MALALVLAFTGCKDPQQVTLACSGTLRVLQGGVSSPEEPWTLSLAVNTEKKSVTVGSYEPTPVFGDASKDTIVFMMASLANNYGVSTGTLNRITGAVSVHIFDEGLRIHRRLQARIQVILK